MIVLHHAAQSRSFRILWFLHEAGLEHRVVRHSFSGRALRDPAFLAISPAGRVPVVEVDGGTLFESGAIVQFLCETRAPGLGRDPGDPARGKFLEWLHYGETLAQHLAQLTFHKVVLAPADRSPVVQKLETLRLRRALEGVEAGLTGGELVPGGFCAADIMVGSSVDLARRFVRIEGMPRLAEWHAALRARPGFQAALVADGEAELYREAYYGD